MSSKTVPNEILIQVFCLLGKEDIRSLLYVCKQWYIAAVPFHFRKIQIREAKIKVDSLFSNGYFTQELTLYKAHPTEIALFDKALNESVFSRLLSALSNLEKLDFQSRVLSGHYISILCQLTDTDMYSKRIKEIVFNSDDSEERVSHFLACYNFRQSIERLETFVSSNDLMSTTSKNLTYFLPRFTCLTQLTYSCPEDSDITLFDILLCCENLIELEFNSRYPIPFRANNQVGTTSNVHLKRLTIASPINTTAYIDYIRILQSLDYLNLNIHDGEYEFFRLTEPFADELQKFKNLRINLSKRVELPEIPLSSTNEFYSVLCKLKGDKDLRYDVTFHPTESNIGKSIVVCEDQLKYEASLDKFDDRSFAERHNIVDRRGIVKSVTFIQKYAVHSLPMTLDYAKTFPRLDNLCIDMGFLSLKINKTKVVVNGSTPWQAFFDKLYDYLPNSETITFEREVTFNSKKLGIAWDLTAFESLKSFSFCVDSKNLKHRDFVLLKFEYHGEDSHCYKRMFLNEKNEKNISANIVPIPSSKMNSNTFIITIRIPNRLVKINCDPYSLYIIQPVEYS